MKTEYLEKMIRHELNGLNSQQYILIDTAQFQAILEDNELLRKELRTAREASEITANLVVRQFEETEKLLHQLQAANALRKAVLDSAAQIAIIATDIKGIITLFNASAEKLLGYRAEEVIGKETPLIFHLESELFAHEKRLSQESKRIIRGMDIFFEYAIQGRLHECEWIYVRKDGIRIPVSLSINPMRYLDGTVNGFLSIATDISERKRSMKMLRESERRYRLLVKNLPSIVYKCYPDGSIEFIDERIESLTGYSKTDLLSGNIKLSDIIAEEDAISLGSLLKQKEDSYISEYRIRKKNGDIVWVEERGQFVYDKCGNVEFIIGSLLDITERKQALKALNESEEKYRSLFVSGPNPVFVIDPQTLEIFDLNPIAEKIYGYTREELVGRPCTELCTNEKDKGLCPGQCKMTIQADIYFNIQRTRHYKKGKEPFYVKVKTCPTIYNGKDAMILAVTDLTEMVEKEAQLIQANKLKSLGEMSAGIAHELNQPLTAIKMGNDFLKMMIESGKNISEQDLLQVVKEVSAQVDRASDIINHLRTFGRKPDFAKGAEEINVNAAVRGVLRIIGQQLSLQNIRTETELEKRLPPILMPPNLLEQVIFNLITNARDAINQKRKIGEGSSDAAHIITIHSFREKGQVIVTVSDTGIGIPDNIRDKIFEPFFTTKEVGKGMGLGLSIIYGIVKDFGGNIEFKSEAGKGATFRLSFPEHLERIPI